MSGRLTDCQGLRPAANCWATKARLRATCRKRAPTRGPLTSESRLMRMFDRLPAREHECRAKDRAAVAGPAAMAPPHVLALQRTAGNHAVVRMLAAGRPHVARLESGKHVPGQRRSTTTSRSSTASTT
jgi:hypothetical protein